MTGEFSGSKDSASLTATSAPSSPMNDHHPVESDMVRAVAMSDGSEDVPPNPASQDSPVAPTQRDQETAAASAPTHPGHPDAPAHDPTRTSQPDRPAALDPTRTSQPNPPAAHDPTRTSQPGQPAAQDPTHTSQPDPPAAHDPTRTSQPGQLAALDPPRTSQPCAATAATPPVIPPRPSVPQLRNPARYHMLGEHGRGGLGKVSRAHDLELGRDVAIKELLSRSAMHEVRFMREALITARLEHPGIVPVHEAGRWPDGTPFYAISHRAHGYRNPNNLMLVLYHASWKQLDEASPECAKSEKDKVKSAADKKGQAGDSQYYHSNSDNL